MDRIILENFRCFRDYQEVELKPLTLLVGENSSGKTSFLAAIRIASELADSGHEPNFNEEPFMLGAFEQIAYRRAIRAPEQTSSFTLGLESAASADALPRRRIVARFGEMAGHPVFSSWMLQLGEFELRLTAPTDWMNRPWQMEVHERKTAKRVEVPLPSFLYHEKLLAFTPVFVARVGVSLLTPLEDAAGETMEGFTKRDLMFLLEHISGLKESGWTKKVSPLAPIRSKPQRTYDPARDIPEPTGSHVPMLLARICTTENERWTRIKRQFVEFGKASGMFEGVDIKSLTKSGSGPFQIVFKIGGSVANLVDVGYGVSQVLPILADTLLARPETTFLLQQPEVHLHPRAQAELGTFLGKTAKSLGHRFVIETHSDYLIDRIRMDVRDGRDLKPEDVSILYFERSGTAVTIYPIKIDSDGNIVDAPPGYRSFFLQEEERFFGVAECV